MKGLGYRQRAILGCLRAFNRPLPTGRLVMACAIEGDIMVGRKTVNMALIALEKRGLARRVRHGWWAAI